MSTSEQALPDFEPSSNDLCECAFEEKYHSRWPQDRASGRSGERWINRSQEPVCNGFRKAKSMREQAEERLRTEDTHVEHPGDVCVCKHTRSAHCAEPDDDTFCAVTGTVYDGYADDCQHFVLAQTALDAQAKLDEACREFDRQADAAEFGEAEEPKPLCPDDCGHDDQDHTLTQGCIHCECNYGREELELVVPEPTQSGYDGYAVTYAVAGAGQFTLYVPNGANVCVIDGQIRVYHLGQPALGITDVHTREV